MPAALVTRSLFAAAALALLFAATSAEAQDAIKCKLPDGRTIYTDIGCPANSTAGVVKTSPNSIDRSAERATVARIHAEHGLALPPGMEPWDDDAPPARRRAPRRQVASYDPDDPNPPSTSVNCDRAIHDLDQASFRLAHTNERTRSRQKATLAQRRQEVGQEWTKSEGACGVERAADRDKMATREPIRRRGYRVYRH